MKRNIIFILTMTLLGIIYPVLSNIRTEATEVQISDVSNTVVVSDVEEAVKISSAEDAITFAELPQIAEPAVKETPKIEETKKAEPAVATTPAKTETPAKVEAPVKAETPVQKSEPVVSKPVAQADHIEIAGNWINIYETDNTNVDAGNSVRRFVKPENNYDGRFLYGHNSSNVFGGLKNLSVGSTFTVTLNNVKKTYRIAKTVIFEKNQETGKLTLNGAGSYMNNVARAKHDGVQYSLSLMTCHGQALGRGDATHRLVLFANEI